MEDCSATQDELISRSRSYRDLQTSWLDFSGNLATPPFPLRKSRGGGMNRSPERKKRKKKKFCAASACRSASAPCICNQAFTFPMFPLPRRSRAAQMDSRLNTFVWKKQPWARWAMDHDVYGSFHYLVVMQVTFWWVQILCLYVDTYCAQNACCNCCVNVREVIHTWLDLPETLRSAVSGRLEVGSFQSRTMIICMVR